MRIAKALGIITASSKQSSARRVAAARGRSSSHVSSLRLALVALLAAQCAGFGLLGINSASAQKKKSAASAPGKSLSPQAAGRTPNGNGGKVYYPNYQTVRSFAPVDVRQIEKQEKLAPKSSVIAPVELKALNPPKGDRPAHPGAPISLPAPGASDIREPQALPASATGVSPPPVQTFKGQEALQAVIPPDTDGAVGTQHVVTATNDRLRIHDRNGSIISTVTTNSFWSGVTLEGGATPSITDPRVRYDRFNQRFIFAIVANPNTLSAATLIAVTATNDPTGTWFRYAIDTDPTATAAGGKWADFPSIGFNKDWIVIQDNLYNFCTPLPSCTPTNNTYAGPAIYVIDKAAIYAGPGSLGTVPTFFDSVNNCTGPVFETQFGCGFTMSPSITEDNTTPNAYLVEDWDSTAAQLRISKLSGPVGAPVLTVGTQIPQSLNSWRFNATRIGTTGGYNPQKDTATYTVNTTARMMANDSRMQNVILRNGNLWCVHHVMVATTPTPAGTQVGGGGANPADNHTAIQWWEMDPSNESGTSTLPTQRGRIEDPTADNCHNGNGGVVATPPCNGSAANQHGTFFVFPSISVNQNNDVLIGFSQLSAFTYPSAAYAFRAAGDPVNTTRDPVVFHPGQSRDNLGGGSGASRQNRWGDYSTAQTDPLNDTDFWTSQEYTGVYRDFGIGVACPWETWWTRVSPSSAAPSKTGRLIISEFRLRGPQGVRDEFVELYNPGASAVIVNTTDNSDGWALATQTTAGTVTGVAVIPNGTVIPPRGHFLFADNPTATADATSVYGLTSYPSTSLRTSESDTGFHIDIPDTNGIAIFNTATPANFNATTVMDAAGPNSLPAGSIFKEGNGYTAPSATTPAGQITFYRDTSSGPPQDTNANENDFVFADTAIETLGITPRLGAAGPRNLNSPLGVSLKSTFVDPGCASQFALDPASPTACQRERSSTAVTNGAAGTLAIRRRFINSTGSTVSRLRFRVVDVTTLNSPGYGAGGQADVRLLSAPDIAAASLSGGGTIAIKGLTLETPPNQPNGGGYNTTVTAGSVTFSNTLTPGDSIDVQFLLGVQTTGNFRFFVIVEALP